MHFHFQTTSPSLITPSSPAHRQIQLLLKKRKAHNLHHPEKNMEVVINSRSCIEPLSPTPTHLKTYKISLIDQIIPTYYVPVILFFPANQNQGTYVSTNTLGMERSLRLKQALSKTLTLFYPLAGRIEDELSIDCNDEGACYIDAKASCSLSECLSHPDPQSIRKLLPSELSSWKPGAGSHVVLIQETTFACGGVSVGVLITHMVADGAAIGSFLRSWASIATKSSEETAFPMPTFDAPSVFLQNNAYPKEATLMAFFKRFFRTGRAATRRFVFDSAAIATLKEKAASSSVHNPSRVESVSAFLSKCIMAMFKAKSGAFRPTLISHAVNVRARAAPPFPEYSFGNIYCPAAALCDTEDPHLTTLVCQIRHAIRKIDGNMVTELQGKDGWLKLIELINETSHSAYAANTPIGVEGIGFTSWCGFGLYDIDFGIGKPVWVVASTEPDESQAQFTTSVVLMNTRTKGIEAWVCLDEKEMALLVQDEELLAYASVDPSPLKL